MRVIKEIIKNIVLVGILASFLLSTSGFVVTRHICSHHETETILGDVVEDYCKIENELEQTASCCNSKKVISKEKSDNCCQFEKTYIRLSENFISSEKPDFSKETQLYSTCALNTVIPATDKLSIPDKEAKSLEQEKIPKVKKHLLFHQVKVEPPLI
ncbi:MAG TPA: hypothetical protein VIN10_13790 [Bacteroidales bacterium]